MGKACLKKILKEQYKTWKPQEKPVFEGPTRGEGEVRWKQVDKKKSPRFLLFELKEIAVCVW